MTKVTTVALVGIMAFAAACAHETPEEVICARLVGCGIVAGPIGTCVSELTVCPEADAALAECADCLDEAACARIAGNACWSTCRLAICD